MLVRIGVKEQNLHIIKIQKLKLTTQLIAKTKNWKILVKLIFRTSLL